MKFIIGPILLYGFLISTNYSFAQPPENPPDSDIRQIFPATKLSSHYKFHFKGKYSEKAILTADGLSLSSIIFYSDTPKGVIFYLHGNTGSLEKWGKIASIYTALHYDIFMLDYRGYGKSGGAIKNERQLYADVQLAYDSIKNIYGENNIIVMGFSIGTGPAAKLAATNQPWKLILQAPYFSLSDAVHHLAAQADTTQLPFQFNLYQYLPKISCPIIIFHGDADQTFYYCSSLKLAALFKPGDQLITLNGADHSDMEKNKTYLAALKNILR